MTKKSASTEYTVHLEGVQVARAENQLIHNVTIRLAHNEFAYLSGPVGGGKSSLLELLYGELPHTQGKAYVLGYNLSNLKRNTLRSHSSSQPRLRTPCYREIPSFRTPAAHRGGSQ